MRAAGVEPNPDMLYPGSGKPWPGVCLACGSSTRCSLNNATSKGATCRVCGVFKYTAARQLSDREARQRMRAAKLRPLNTYPGYFVPWDSECMVLGETTSPTLSNVMQLGHVCRPCSRLLVSARTRISRVDLIELCSLNGLTLIVAEYTARHCFVVATHNICGSRVRVSLSNLRAGQGACADCASVGFTPQLPGWVYLLERYGTQHKIGITNRLKVRLNKHKRAGWVTLDTAGPFMPGALARQEERRVLRWFDTNSIPRGGRAFAQPFAGHTESWNRSDFSVAKLIDLGVVAP